MKPLILPELVAIGIYNAQLAVKNTDVTKNRKTTMFEIEIPIENGGVSFIDNESHAITKNTVICAKPGQVRHTRLPFKCYYIHMIVGDGELYDRLMKIPSYVSVDNREHYEKIFEQLCNSYQTAPYQDLLLLQSKILELIHLLCEHMQNWEFNGNAMHKEMIENAVQFIKSNLTDDLSLEAMSKHASFSPIHFHNCFKKATGKTLREFVEEQRLHKAMHLLAGTDLTLSEIAYECGFSSQSYFSYAFKRKMRIPPREYAKKLHQRYEYPISCMP